MSEKRRDKKGRLLQPNERQRKDGRYEYRYTDIYGKKQSIYSWKLVPTDSVPSGKRCDESLREAEKRIELSLANGVDPSLVLSAKICDYYEIYIADRSDVSERTLELYEWAYRRCIEKRLGNAQISMIRSDDIYSFYSDLLDKEGLAMSSVDNVNSVLSAIFEKAIENNVIKTNPCNGTIYKLKRGRKYNKKRVYALSADEQVAFLSYCKESKSLQHWLPLITFILGTGCRIGETLALTWADCDFDKGFISINKSAKYCTSDISEKCQMNLGAPKTSAGYRDIPMLDAVREALLEERRRQQEIGMMNGVAYGEYTGFVWRTKKNTLPIPGTIRAMLKTAKEKYNEQEISNAIKEGRQPILIEQFSPHKLRHTFCTRLCENETNLAIIQDVMGHADIRTTMEVYNDVTAQAKLESLKKLNDKIVL